VPSDEYQETELPPTAWQAIRAYLEAAGRLDTLLPGDFIFVALSDRALRLPQVDDDSGSGERSLSRREFHRILKRYARAAGLDASQVNARVLRRTAAHLYQLAGADTGRLSRLLGHTDKQSTQRYLQDSEPVTWATVASMLGLDE